MAGYVPSNQQGELQGALTSLMSLTMVFGPGIMNNLYYHFTKVGAPVHFPGVHFLLGGLLMLASVWAAWRVLRVPPPANPEPPMNESSATPGLAH